MIAYLNRRLHIYHRSHINDSAIYDRINQAVQFLADASKGELVMTPAEFIEHIMPLLRKRRLYLIVDAELHMLHHLATTPADQQSTVQGQWQKVKERQRQYTELNKLKRDGSTSVPHVSVQPFALRGG